MAEIDREADRHIAEAVAAVVRAERGGGGIVTPTEKHLHLQGIYRCERCRASAGIAARTEADGWHRKTWELTAERDRYRDEAAATQARAERLQRALCILLARRPADYHEHNWEAAVDHAIALTRAEHLR